MEDNELKTAISPLSVTACTAKQPKRIKTEEEKKELKCKEDQRSNKVCVTLRQANLRWRALWDHLRLNLDYKLAVVLLDLFVTFIRRCVRYHLHAEWEERFSMGEG